MTGLSNTRTGFKAAYKQGGFQHAQFGKKLSSTYSSFSSVVFNL